MENKNMIDELEQVREQMQVLRDKLDKQEIVNDKLIRNSVRSKMSWVKKFVYLEFLLVPFIALVWYGFKDFFDISWWNYAFMVIATIIDTVLDYYVNVVSLKTSNMESANLTDTMNKLYKMKQIRAKQFYIMISLGAIWIVWTGIEMWQFTVSITEMDGLMQSATYGGLGGLVIGIPLGFYATIRIYRKMQRTNDELIEQIRDFS